MHWLIMYVMVLFPTFTPSPQFAASLAQDFHVDYDDNVIAEYVDFARACVNGDGPCY